MRMMHLQALCTRSVFWSRTFTSTSAAKHLGGLFDQPVAE